jgi:acetylornithine/succinyldiaminopimelate/putrescine aminotransferase
MGSAAKDVVNRLLKLGIIANAAHETVLRLLPPFVITRKHIEDFMGVLDEILTEIESA